MAKFMGTLPFYNFYLAQFQAVSTVQTVREEPQIIMERGQFHSLVYSTLHFLHACDN